jgi:hypothetical protein
MTPALRHHAALPDATPPRDLARHLTAAIASVDARLRVAHDALSVVQRDTPRADGGWSVHAVLEHMALTNEAYLERLHALVPRLQTQHVSPIVTPWRPTLMGKWLARSLEMRMPLPAPRRVQPGPAARPEVLHAVLASHQSIVTLMTDVVDTSWTVERMVSPLNSLVRVNFGDACVIVLRHSERHVAQIERLVAELAPRLVAR